MCHWNNDKREARTLQGSVDICHVFSATSHPDPPEVHWLSNQLVVLWHFFLGGKLHKAFTDLSTQTESTKKNHAVQCCLTERYADN